MIVTNKLAILTELAEIPDNRVVGRSEHDLVDILFVALCGAVAGCDSWVDIEAFAKKRLKWLRKYVSLSNGVPSHDTFGRVFALLDTGAFLATLMRWMESLRKESKGDIVAIDGKTLRRSFDKASGKAALHLVCAWSVKNRLMLGQVATGEKSNEITAIPELIELLDLCGATVTIDAMGCQKEIAEAIRNAGADYVLALKENHPLLHAAVAEEFLKQAENDFKGGKAKRLVRNGRSHGRKERREYVILPVPEDLTGREEWKDLRSIGMVAGYRTIEGKESVELRYYLSSLHAKVNPFARTVRGHWGIENNLHWSLDVTFTEDQSRIRKGSAPETTALLRRVAVSLLQQDTSSKRSLRVKRLCAGWDPAEIIDYIAGKH